VLAMVRPAIPRRDAYTTTVSQPGGLTSLSGTVWKEELVAMTLAHTVVQGNTRALFVE
jgi:hypothetical protein